MTLHRNRLFTHHSTLYLKYRNQDKHRKVMVYALFNMHSPCQGWANRIYRKVSLSMTRTSIKSLPVQPSSNFQTTLY